MTLGVVSVPQGREPLASLDADTNDALPGDTMVAKPDALPDVRRRTQASWRSSYVRGVVLGDILCAVLAATVGLLTKFGVETSPTHMQNAAVWVACSLPAIWPLAMMMAGSYERRFLWVGADEFTRVFWASTTLLASVATVSWALKLEVARGFVVIVLPLLTVLTLLNRYAQRSALRRRRSAGGALINVVLVGHAGGVDQMHRQIVRMSHRGYRVVGCCVPSRADAALIEAYGTVPVLGELAQLSDLVRQHGVDVVAALPSQDLRGDDLRHLGWELEATDADLVLIPALNEVAGPRIRLRPGFGMPILQVERLGPVGHRGAMKDVLDRVLAGVAVLLFSPLILGLFLAIKLTSRGPALFRHDRIGRNGRTFRMLKFRSMYEGADAQFDSLLGESEGNAVQFKMRRDPRVTPIGRFLRRYSIDELPQLFNVLGGTMSLVGPRPHVQREVDQYDRDMRRRLLVKPGMTGLWQVSGRSNLSWEESVRIDVRYVEYWSLALDLVILGKTFRAVTKGSGAY
jgi:exopolysaccharide biosynthesis polyprenyl glycosylphosphotransferase